MTSQLDRRSAAVWFGAFLLLGVAGCAGIGATSRADGSTGPQPSTCDAVATAAPSMPARDRCDRELLSAYELRLVLIDQLGPLWYCDRDSYPVARDEQEAALASYAAMLADRELFHAVAARLGIDPTDTHTDLQKLQLYRLWKTAQAVQLDPVGNDRYRFDYLAQPVAGAADGRRTAGIVDARGALTVEQEAAAGEPICPICLSIGTRIDTPDGGVPVDRLRIGDAVWTLDRSGRRLRGVVIALGSTRAPVDHHVIRLTLADGRTVTASPGHPLADERTLADLRGGQALDGSRVSTVERLAYDGARTYDLAVSGETGVYLAGGIPLGSTLD